MNNWRLAHWKRPEAGDIVRLHDSWFTYFVECGAVDRTIGTGRILREYTDKDSLSGMCGAWVDRFPALERFHHHFTDGRFWVVEMLAGPNKDLIAIANEAQLWPINITGPSNCELLAPLTEGNQHGSL